MMLKGATLAVRAAGGEPAALESRDTGGELEGGVRRGVAQAPRGDMLVLGRGSHTDARGGVTVPRRAGVGLPWLLGAILGNASSAGRARCISIGAGSSRLPGSPPASEGSGRKRGETCTL